MLTLCAVFNVACWDCCLVVDAESQMQKEKCEFETNDTLLTKKNNSQSEKDLEILLQFFYIYWQPGQRKFLLLITDRLHYGLPLCLQNKTTTLGFCYQLLWFYCRTSTGLIDSKIRKPLFQDDEDKGKATGLGDEVLEKAGGFAETDEVIWCSWLIGHSNCIHKQSLNTAFLLFDVSVVWTVMFKLTSIFSQVVGPSSKKAKP